MKLNWTKVEGTETFEAQLSGKLLEVSNDVRTLDNEKQTPYRLAKVKVDGKNYSALMYDKNFQHGVEVGDELACKAFYDPARGKEILITVSHLIASTRATIEDFGFPSEVKEKVEEIVDELSSIEKA